MFSLQSKPNKLTCFVTQITNVIVLPLNRSC